MLLIGLIIIGLLAAGMLIIGIVDGNRFVVREEHFSLSGLSQDCKFVMISDLHNKQYGKDNEKLIAAIQKAAPDFIIIAGDLITAHKKESIDAGVALVNALSKQYKIYYGLGNHETKLRMYENSYGKKYDKLIKGIQHENVRVLRNESCILPDYRISLSGLELDRAYFAKFKKQPLPIDYMQKHVGKPEENCCKILIAHNPDYFEQYAQWGADLVLAGHVHGGIMRLPILGGVISPSYTLFPKYDGGIFHEAGSTMLLGRGMGAHTLPFRFFNPAELYVVYCERKK